MSYHPEKLALQNQTWQPTEQGCVHLPPWGDALTAPPTTTSCKGNGMHLPQEMGTSEFRLPSTFRIPGNQGLGVYVVWTLHLLKGKACVGTKGVFPPGALIL